MIMHLGKIPAKNKYDAIIVGSGPNGLAAAITIAQAGHSVLVLEAKDIPGGGARTAELTLPGFHHDICSAIHPMAVASPFFRGINLSNYGLEWIFPPAALAHPFDDGTAVILERSVNSTADMLGEDSNSYKSLMNPLVTHWKKIFEDALRPLHIPHHPVPFLQFAMHSRYSVRGLAQRFFRGEKAQALFAGIGAHSLLPLEYLFSASVGLILATAAHVVGWPIVKGGSQQIIDAMVHYLNDLGGKIQTNVFVASLEDIPRSHVVLLDITPRQLLRMALKQIDSGYQKALESHKYGPGVFKMDWALDGPIPWKAKECLRAATVHVGGTLDEISRSESEVWQGKNPQEPFVILAQQSLFDESRAPAGKHTVWGYCHVPNGSDFNMTERIEMQIERFAPGFRDCILSRHSISPKEIENYNPNYIGGDIAGGMQDVWQLLIRPALRCKPYATALRGIYLCSSSTPPGAGVHGMCGYKAAQVALKDVFRQEINL